MMSPKTDNRGFLALFGTSAAIFWPGALAFGFPGVMAPHWQRMFQVGTGAIGNTLFFVLVALGIFMFFVGRWQERFGMRKMIMIGTVLLAANLLIIAFASNLAMLYLWAFLNGTATCFIYTPALTCVQRWFPGRRGLVSGVVNFTFGISAAIMSPLFHRMVESMGYVAMNLMVAAMTLATGMVAAQFTESPEHLALRATSSDAPQTGPLLNLEHSLTVRESIRTRSFWFLWLTWAFQGAAGVAMVTLSITFGLSKGYSMASAVMILTAFNVMNGGGRLVMGYLSDTMNRSLAMSLTFLASGGAYLLLPHVSGLTMTSLLASVIGFSFGTLFAVSAPLAADCFGLRHFGAILGLVFTAYGFVAGLLGPSLSGYLLDLTGGNFTIVFSYLGVFCILSGWLIRSVIPPELESPVQRG
jgi:OFA family oxalate/formate antiporter-like MFS transporter